MRLNLCKHRMILFRIVFPNRRAIALKVAVRKVKQFLRPVNRCLGGGNPFLFPLQPHCLQSQQRGQSDAHGYQQNNYRFSRRLLTPYFWRGILTLMHSNASPFLYIHSRSFHPRYFSMGMALFHGYGFGSGTL